MSLLDQPDDAVRDLVGLEVLVSLALAAPCESQSFSASLGLSRGSTPGAKLGVSRYWLSADRGSGCPCVRGCACKRRASPWRLLEASSSPALSTSPVLRAASDPLSGRSERRPADAGGAMRSCKGSFRLLESRAAWHRQVLWREARAHSRRQAHESSDLDFTWG